MNGIRNAYRVFVAKYTSKTEKAT